MSPLAHPSVSVVIAVHNGEAYLGETLQSISAQTAPADEIIVVDDGSADRSAAIAGSFPKVRVLAQPHRGVASAMNRGIEAVRTDYVSFVDSDDLWEKQKLELQWRSLAVDGPVDLLFGMMRSFHSPELTEAVRSGIACPEGEQVGKSSCALLAPRSVFSRIGLFSTEHRVGHFVDWCARAVDLGCTERVLPQVLFHRRLHANSLSRRDVAMRKDFARMMKGVLDRRRGTAKP